MSGPRRGGGCRVKRGGDPWRCLDNGEVPRWIVMTASAAVVVAVAAVSIVTVVHEESPPTGPGPQATRTAVRVEAPQTRMPGEVFQVSGKASIDGASYTGVQVHLQRQDETS